MDPAQQTTTGGEHTQTGATPVAAAAAPGSSLIGGHVQYVKGMAETAVGAVVGTVTNADAWKKSGEDDKSGGLQQMRDAAETRDPNAQGFGKIEQVAGNLVGCEGMQQEGAASVQKKQD